ncbi:MAG: hypothetical protein ABIN37_09620, partial [Burkholderiaceae bacterium]
AVVRHVAHRVAVMYGGRVVEIGSSAKVFGNPGHPYTRSLLEAVPVPEPALQRARLAQAPDDLDFRAVLQSDGPCVFGEQHTADAPHWHWLAPGHGVSCRHWPAQAARPGSV